ncbi:MAG: hypothetical protein RR283_00810 [Comamonas sp.]|uniref:hypothetical protein n=1 Tax=Comamonas sp. TaxID=34028 RepID=UPI003A94E9B3
MPTTLPLRLCALAASAMLSGCLVPERFSARITIHPDAAYSYRFNGTVVDAMALLKQHRQGVLSDKDHQGLAAEAQKLSEEPDVKKAVYLGNARYTLEMDGSRSAGEPLKLLDMFSVQTDAEGVMTIAAKALKNKEGSNLAQLGIHVDGTLQVRLPANAQVISQNANVTPVQGQGSYRWNMGRLDQRPEMQIRFQP